MRKIEMTEVDTSASMVWLQVKECVVQSSKDRRDDGLFVYSVYFEADGNRLW
jgi:hypothetical protein